MKADELGSAPKAEKYGMLIQYAPRIVDRHFGMMDEEVALAGARLLYQIKQSRVLRATEDRTRQRAAPPPTPPAQPLAEALPEAQDWRAKLGLG